MDTFLIATFYLSGAVVFLLLMAKVVETRRGKRLFILTAISRGDERFRVLAVALAHKYSDLKEKAIFLVEKQVPKHLRSSSNRAANYIETQAQKYLGDIRNSRLLKRNGGISEYFKNISDSEKGNGKIEDTFDQMDPEEIR